MMYNATVVMHDNRQKTKILFRGTYITKGKEKPVEIKNNLTLFVRDAVKNQNPGIDENDFSFEVFYEKSKYNDFTFFEPEKK